MRIGINGGVHGMFGTPVEGIVDHAVQAERQQADLCERGSFPLEAGVGSPRLQETVYEDTRHGQEQQRDGNLTRHQNAGETEASFRSDGNRRLVPQGRAQVASGDPQRGHQAEDDARQE